MTVQHERESKLNRMVSPLAFHEMFPADTTTE